MEQIPQEQPQGQPPPQDMMRMRNMAQIALARAAYPELDGNSLMGRWGADGWSSRFSDYFEDSSHTQELASFDVSDQAATQELLKKIRAYNRTPGSLH